MQHLVERFDLGKARLGRPRQQAKLRARGDASLEDVFVTSSTLMPCRLTTARTFAKVPTLSIIRMTSWKRAAVEVDTLTTFGTVPSSRNERMTRTVSVAMANCA